MLTKTLKHYSGLYGDDEIRATTDFFQCEPLAFRSKTYNWEISEHFHSELLQLFFIKNGKGQLVMNSKTLAIESPCVLLIPANTLHGFHFFEQVEGDVFTVSERYLENIFKENTPIFTEPIQKIQILYSNNRNEFDKVVKIYEEINRELKSDFVGKKIALRGWLELLFLRFYRGTFEEEKRELLQNNPTLAYYRKFTLLIKRSKNNEKRVTDYASLLKISTVHLNRICREIVGKSALQIIQENMIQDAKNYLLNTSYSSAEIAYFLNFNDPAYFNRLFKKLVGVSPGVFRKS